MHIVTYRYYHGIFYQEAVFQDDLIIFSLGGKASTLLFFNEDKAIKTGYSPYGVTDLIITHKPLPGVECIENIDILK